MEKKTRKMEFDLPIHRVLVAVRSPLHNSMGTNAASCLHSHHATILHPVCPRSWWQRVCKTTVHLLVEPDNRKWLWQLPEIRIQKNLLSHRNRPTYMPSYVRSKLNNFSLWTWSLKDPCNLECLKLYRHRTPKTKMKKHFNQ